LTQVFLSILGNPVLSSSCSERQSFTSFFTSFIHFGHRSATGSYKWRGCPRSLLAG